jgi:hypothetical protein
MCVYVCVRVCAREVCVCMCMRMRTFVCARLYGCEMALCVIEWCENHKYTHMTY